MESNHFVKYEFHDLKNFNYYNFSNYKLKNGKRVEYLDVNGENSKLIWHNATVLLDMNNEGNALIDIFLKTHPSVLMGEWKRTDLTQQEKALTKNTLDSARAIIDAAKMTDAEVKQFAILKRMNLNAEMDTLRAKIIGIAQASPASFMETHFDPEKDLRVFIVEAVKERKLEYSNDTFYYGKEAIGTNEEQVLVWLKDNKDILAILKHEIRGEEKPKKKLAKK